MLSACQRTINTYALIDSTQPEADSGLLWTQHSRPSVNLYNNHCLIHSPIYPPIHPPIYPSTQAYVSYLSNGFANPALYFSDFLNSSPIEPNIFVSRNLYIIESWIPFPNMMLWMNEPWTRGCALVFLCKTQEEESWEWTNSYSKGLKFFKLGVQMFLTGAGCFPNAAHLPLFIQCVPSTWDGSARRIVPCLGTW